MSPDKLPNRAALSTVGVDADWACCLVIIFLFTITGIGVAICGSPFLRELLALIGGPHILEHIHVPVTLFANRQGLIRNVQNWAVL